MTIQGLIKTRQNRALKHLAQNCIVDLPRLTPLDASEIQGYASLLASLCAGNPDAFLACREALEHQQEAIA